MTEREINGRLFAFSKLNVFDQQYVFGKLSDSISKLVVTLNETKDENKAFFALQKGFSDLGRETFKEVAMLLLSKVKYCEKASDNISVVRTDIVAIGGGGFQFDWIEHDFVLFEALVIHAFEENFTSFLATPSA